MSGADYEAVLNGCHLRDCVFGAGVGVFPNIWLRDSRYFALVARVEKMASLVLPLPSQAVAREWSFKAHQVYLRHAQS